MGFALPGRCEETQGRKASNMKPVTVILLLAAAALASACAEARPVFYPNAHYTQVGEQAAQADLDACIQFANESKASGDKGTEVAKSTAGGAAVGGAVGAATGAVLGNFGRGLGAGAAGGAAGGLVTGLFKASEPDPVFKSFVDRCLREKGYDVIGWR
jgi:hypothetical protein